MEINKDKERKSSMVMIRTAAFLAGAGLLVFWIVFCIQSVVFNHGFYQDLYRRIDLAHRENLKEEDLENAIYTMTDYVEGKREDLLVNVTWKGSEQQAFNEKETAHMEDVRALWQHAKTAMIAGIISFVLLVLLLYWKTGSDCIGYLCRGLLQAMACFAVILVFFGFWALIDFTGFWIQFHHIFFSNQLWLLDPATDFMIVICPEEMFSSMIGAIVLPAVIGMAAAGFGAWYYLRRKAKIGI